MKLAYLLLILASLHLGQACNAASFDKCEKSRCRVDWDCGSECRCRFSICEPRSGKKKRSASLLEENRQHEGLGSVLDGDFCKKSPCSLGQGDCDDDSECLGNLVCGLNNCRNFTPTAFAYSDFCYAESTTTSGDGVRDPMDRM